jgi:hypothetical protein
MLPEKNCTARRVLIELAGLTLMSTWIAGDVQIV